MAQQPLTREDLWVRRASKPRCKLGRTDGGEFFVAELAGDQSLPRRSAVSQSEVCAAIQEWFQTCRDSDRELDFGVASLVLGEAGDQPFGADGRRNADTDTPARVTRRVFQGASGLLDDLQSGTNLGVISGAGFGKDDSSIGAAEERLAEPSFQTADTMAYGGWRKLEMFCRANETSQSCCRIEG